jgi:hypothetical protein
MRRSLLALAAISLWGCQLIDNIGPQNRLADQVHGLNDEVRWGRVDLASQRVASAHRAAFLAQHRGWGGDIRIADVDVTNLEFLREGGGAASIVSYAWIDERTMELRSTSVRQRWVADGEGFLLAGEEILGGEAELLDGAPLATGEDDAAGDDVSTSGGESPGAEGDGEAAPAPAPAPSRPIRRDAQGMPY